MKIISIQCVDCKNYFEMSERGYKCIQTRGCLPRCSVCRNEYSKKLERERKRGKNKRDKGSNTIFLICKICKNPTPVKEYKVKHHESKGGKICRKCQSEISSAFLKKLKSEQTPLERSECGKKARASVSSENMSNGVRKQWETIKSDSKHFNKICNDKSIRMKKVWDEKYDDETKKRIITAFGGSWGKARSKISQQLKDDMDKAGMKGFESEQYFHGFIPDEINHELKIIVEMYGQVYHCDPRKYKDPLQFLKVTGRTVGEQWKRDRIRLAAFYRNGYSVVIVWEKDYRNNPQKELERIQNEIDRKKSSS